MFGRRRPTGVAMSVEATLRRHVELLAGEWPQIGPRHVVVAGGQSVASQLPAADGRCGIYVLSFDDGQLYVGQAKDVVRRFGDHRQTYADIAEMHFWCVPTAG